MYHPEEEEEEDEDEFLSDDVKVGHSKDQAKLKGACWVYTKNTGLKCSSGNELCPSGFSIQPCRGRSRGQRLHLEGQQPGQYGGRGAVAVPLG